MCRARTKGVCCAAIECKRPLDAVCGGAWVTHIVCACARRAICVVSWQGRQGRAVNKSKSKSNRACWCACPWTQIHPASSLTARLARPTAASAALPTHHVTQLACPGAGCARALEELTLHESALHATHPCRASPTGATGARQLLCAFHSTRFHSPVESAAAASNEQFDCFTCTTTWRTSRAERHANWAPAHYPLSLLPLHCCNGADKRERERLLCCGGAQSCVCYTMKHRIQISNHVTSVPHSRHTAGGRSANWQLLSELTVQSRARRSSWRAASATTAPARPRLTQRFLPTSATKPPRHSSLIHHSCSKLTYSLPALLAVQVSRATGLCPM